MSTMRRLFQSSMARTLETLISIAIGLFMLPFMISQLGESLYGIWILIGGFTATLHLMDFGFASAVTRFMARSISRGDSTGANTTLCSALIVYSGLAALVLAVTLAIAWISPIWVEDPSNISLIRVLIFITGLSLALEFPFKAFAGISVAYMRYDLNSLSRITVRLISTAVLVFALLEGYKLTAVAIIGLSGTMVSNILFACIAKYLFKGMRLHRRYISVKSMKELSNYSMWAFANDLTRLLHKKIDIFMIGAYLGTSVLTTYYVALRLVEYSLQFLGRATGITTPIFTASQANGDMEGLKDKMIIFTRINILLGGYSVFAFILLGKPLIRLWMGADFNYQQAYLALCIVLSGKILLFIFGPLASTLMAISRHHWLALLSTAEIASSAAIIFFTLTWTDWGLTGVAAGVAAPFFISRLVILPIIVRHEIELGIKRLFSSISLPLALAVTAGVCASWLLSNVLMTSTLPEFLFAGFLITTVYWSIVLFSVSTQEWHYLAKILPRRLTDPIFRRLSRS